ncbi:hypothetical protein D3C79_1020690 [compost metagenome]
MMRRHQATNRSADQPTNTKERMEAAHDSLGIRLFYINRLSVDCNTCNTCKAAE